MKTFYLLAGVLLLTSCVSVKKYNQRLNEPLAPAKLHADVDFTIKKLEKLHPHLYQYISKKDFHHKVDSIKASILQPQTPLQFYKKLAPLVAEIRQGHLRLHPPLSRSTKAEEKQLLKKSSLLGQFDYKVYDNRLFVAQNRDSIPNINRGTEIVSVNHIRVQQLLGEYKSYYSSDGYNTTFRPYMAAKIWTSIFTAEYGMLDSIEITARNMDHVSTFWLRRRNIAETKKEEEKRVKQIRKTDSGRVADYNTLSRSFNRELSFVTKDSAVALMKIKTFSGTYSSRFYREKFSVLKKSPARYLILDLRDNLGGSLFEINNLYSYFVSEEFRFIKDIEITSYQSLLQADYLSLMNWKKKTLAVLGYPVYVIGTLLATKKEVGRTYLRNNKKIASIYKPKENSFKGKIYVLINGGSFSASSIISSKLKSDHRAVLVGEETGGANDGTVAGRYVTVKLPESKLILPIGMMHIQPNINFTHTKKGVEPDVEIIPTLEQELADEDVQLEFILNQIAAERDSATIL